jgi:hypothetical protein
MTNMAAWSVSVASLLSHFHMAPVALVHFRQALQVHLERSPQPMHFVLRLRRNWRRSVPIQTGVDILMATFMFAISVAQRQRIGLSLAFPVPLTQD